MKTALLVTSLVITMYCDAVAAPLVLAYNSAGTELRDYFGVPLYNGSLFFSQGDIIQIGYFTQATPSDPFAGDWVTWVSTAIGDKAEPRPGPGLFRFQDSFSPAGLLGGTALAIRFYDAPSLSGATYFNTVSDNTGAWNWTTVLSREPLTLSLSAPTLVWQDGTGSAFRTTIPVPEPSGLALAAGAGIFMIRRRRRSPQG